MLFTAMSRLVAMEFASEIKWQVSLALIAYSFPVQWIERADDGTLEQCQHGFCSIYDEGKYTMR